MAGEEMVREYIIENFLFGERQKLTDTISLLDAGIVDSTGILEIVAFLEEQFQIEICDNELLPENLDSIKAISGYIDRKKG